MADKQLKRSEALVRAQEAYRKRNKNKGMTRVNVWVPTHYADELRDIAADMRQDANLQKEESAA